MVCQGTITSKRVTTQRTEQSAISFVLVSEDLVNQIESVIIDEDRDHVLTRISKTRHGTETKESDHNVIKTSLKLHWNKDKSTRREALFNLKNKDCQKKFKAETSHNTKLSRNFDVIDDLDAATEAFMKKLNKVIHKCFKKVGQRKGRYNSNHEKIYTKWRNLRKKAKRKNTI